jgi:hypothetical protein
MSQRRFPPPWSVEEQDVCFVVRDVIYIKAKSQKGMSALR